MRDERDWFPTNLTAIPGLLRADWTIATDRLSDVPARGYFVYAVATADRPIHRANGSTSRLLYVGMGYSNRPRSLFDGTHSASHALQQTRRALCPHWLAHETWELPVEVWIAPADDAVLHEAKILNFCATFYGELPPANRKWEGYLSGAVVRELVRWAFDGADAPAGATYEWPKDTPLSVWRDVYAPGKGGAWQFSLGWIHTARLLRERSGEVPADLQGRLLLVGPGDNAEYLSRVRSLGDWSPCHPTSLPAAELDALGPPSALHDWLGRVTGCAWERGATPYHTLRTLLERAAHER
ncbi:MAG: hypothetical protein Q8P18_21550 [Pseudomonadota bacterium]|nr:hypothetical protein [Pseudomonadota bacterium]